MKSDKTILNAYMVNKVPANAIYPNCHKCSKAIEGKAYKYTYRSRRINGGYSNSTAFYFCIECYDDAYGKALETHVNRVIDMIFEIVDIQKEEFESDVNARRRQKIKETLKLLETSIR